MPSADHEAPADGGGAPPGAARLVRMANQIAGFFATQGPETQAAEVAGHLKAFWEPRMLRTLRAHVEAGGAGLSPLALEGARRLAALDDATRPPDLGGVTRPEAQD